MTEADHRLLLLSPRDNVVVARMNLSAGETVLIQGLPVRLSANVPLGFKIARFDIAPSDKVLKYGAVIGSATSVIRCGDIVHLHNMKSDYLLTYSYEEGHGFTNRTR